MRFCFQPKIQKARKIDTYSFRRKWKRQLRDGLVNIYTGTDQKVRVTKTVYNPIGRYYTEIGVGEPEKTITEAIIGVGKWGG